MQRMLTPYSVYSGPRDALRFIFIAIG